MDLALAFGAASLVLTGALLSGLATRRRLSRLPAAFSCRIRPAVPTGRAPAWSRRPCLALWVHDGLVVVSGRLRPRIATFGVHFAEGTLPSTGRPDAGRHGHQPVSLLLELDNGEQLIMSASAADRPLLAGPYLAALVATSAHSQAD